MAWDARDMSGIVKGRIVLASCTEHTWRWIATVDSPSAGATLTAFRCPPADINE